MNTDIELMLKIYEPNGIDWMGNEIKSLFDLTRHHIIKREKGGIDDISNYALLTKDSHILLHYLEDHYNREYNYNFNYVCNIFSNNSREHNKRFFFINISSNL